MFVTEFVGESIISR